MRGDPNETTSELVARQVAHLARRGVKAPKKVHVRTLVPGRSPKHPMPPSYTGADGVTRPDKRVTFDPAAHAWFTEGAGRPWFRPNMFQRKDDQCSKFSP